MRQQRSWKDKCQLVKRGGSSGGGGGGSTGELKSYYSANPNGSHDDIASSYAFDPGGAIDQYAALTGLSEQQVALSLEAINDFTHTSYTTMRDSEFAGKPTKEVTDIYKFLEVAPKYKGAIYRGLNFETRQQLQSFLKNAAIGKTFTLKAMSSFSSSHSMAENFAEGNLHGVLMEVKANRSGSSIKNISGHRFEDEVLAPKGAKYRVVNSKTEKIDAFGGTMTKIQLEEVP